MAVLNGVYRGAGLVGNSGFYLDRRAEVEEPNFVVLGEVCSAILELPSTQHRIVDVRGPIEEEGKFERHAYLDLLSRRETANIPVIAGLAKRLLFDAFAEDYDLTHGLEVKAVGIDDDYDYQQAAYISLEFDNKSIADLIEDRTQAIAIATKKADVDCLPLHASDLDGRMRLAYVKNVPHQEQVVNKIMNIIGAALPFDILLTPAVTSQEQLEQLGQ